MIEFWHRVDSLLTQGQTLKWLCEEIKENYDKIINLRHRERHPSLEIAFKIARVLGTSIEFLYAGIEPYDSDGFEVSEEQILKEKTIEEIIKILKKNNLI